MRAETGQTETEAPESPRNCYFVDVVMECTFTHLEVGLGEVGEHTKYVGKLVIGSIVLVKCKCHHYSDGIAGIDIVKGHQIY